MLTRNEHFEDLAPMASRTNTLTLTRLEKAAADCGFERSPKHVDGGLLLSSAQFPESVSVKLKDDTRFIVSASSPTILSRTQWSDEVGHITGWDELYNLLELAAASARNLPNRVAQKFTELTIAMPRSTEVERFVVQRVGQDLFRSALLDFWGNACCITGLAIPELLKASHIKPWAQCDSDEERLDVFNGLLLAPHLDALFDGGWLTVEDTGRVRFSTQIAGVAMEQLGLPQMLEVGGLSKAHFPYLAYHREEIFKG